MLTEQGCLKRRQRLWDTLPQQVEWVLISNQRHIKYFSNFWVNPISFSSGMHAWLHLERSGKATLITDNFTLKSSSNTPYVDSTIAETWYDGKHSVSNRDYKALTALGKNFPNLDLTNGLIEFESYPIAAATLLKNKPVDDILLGDVIKKLRRQKEPDEIELMIRCMKACEAGHTAALEFVRPGVTDMDVYRKVNAAVLKTTNQPCIVYGDFKANNAETPKAGGLPEGYTLKEGDLYILDYSVLIDGYRSDFTNTIAVGTPTDDQQALFNACLAGMEAGETALKAEASCSDIFKITSDQVVQKGFQPLPSHAGHGLGMEHPEPPAIVSESTDILMEGDVVTLEPGNYLPGIGGVRVERNYLITENGYQCLSNHDVKLKL